MKKTLIVLAFATFALASCGGNNSKAEENVDNAQEKASEMTDDLMDEMDSTADTIQAATDTLSNEMNESVEETK